MNIADLSKPFDPKKVHWRIGATNQKKVARETNNQKARPTKGIALAYIDARDVMERLDEVCGPENWQSKYEHASNHGYVCSIGIRIGDEWVWKANGAGETQVEAQKGAMSDSFKRAAILWGIGRYLYDVKSPWVSINQYGDIDENDMARLVALLPNAPKQAPKQDTPKAKTPFDDEPAQQQVDETLIELEDIINTVDGISEVANLNGFWKTGRVQDFYKSLPEELKTKLVNAFGERKQQLGEESDQAA